MMRVLQIAPKPPYPKIDGGCIAMASVVENLNCDVYLGFVSTEKHPFKKVAFPPQFQDKIVAHTQLKTKPNLYKAFLSLFSSSSYFISRFYSKQFEKELIHKIELLNPDIIQLESLFLANYIPALKKTNTKIILRAHNVESDIWKERVKKSSFLKRIVLNFIIKRFIKSEISAFQSVDAIVAISQNEIDFAKKYAPQTPSILIPLGVNKSQVESNYADSFFHIGAMDWDPNIEGVNWLINEVWPSVENETSLTLHLAGKSLEVSLYKSIKGVLNHGEVKSASNFMLNSGILVVPLFSGSGIRIKIIEAGLLAIPLIATDKAVEGLNLVADVDFLLANTATEFHLQMCKLAKDKELQRRIGANIQARIVMQFDKEHLNKQLIEFYRSI